MHETTIRIPEEVVAALDKECEEADLNRSEYIRSIIRDRNPDEQLAVAGITSEQLQAQTEIILSRMDELESASEAASPANPPETYDQQAVLDELAQRGVDIQGINQTYPGLMKYVVSYIGELPNAAIQEQALDLFEVVIEQLRSSGGIYYQDTIMQSVKTETDTVNPQYTFAMAVWPWLKKMWVENEITITPSDGDLKIE